LSNYHIIGDIHGHADKLEELLLHLGYKNSSGVYQHNNAKVVFLGDFIDRGSQHRRVIEIVRSMVDQGHALAVMGNHEFNAICYHTLHPETADPLRPHSEKNTRQHEAFLKEYALKEEETQNVIAWFKKLPLYLEIKNSVDGSLLFRAVHACWNQKIIDRTLPILTDEYIVNTARKESQHYEDIEVLLKGPEIPLPRGETFEDKDENVRHNIRIKWWETTGHCTYRDIGMVPEGVVLPETRIEAVDNDSIYPEDAPPVFFGHYWLSGKPRIIRNNLACLDYSAGKGGSLVAYHWDGGRDGVHKLQDSAFIYVE
jgi:hypothetical protein